MNKIKVAIFDLDGTIIDTLQDLANTGNMVLKNNNLPTHDIDKFRFFVGSGIKNLCIRMLPDEKKDDEKFVEKIFNEFNKTYAIHFMDSTCAYEGMLNSLKGLIDRGIKVAVLTNKAQEFTTKMLDKVYSNFPFSFILGKTDKFPVKPDKKLVEYFLSELGVKGENCIYFGDSNVDMLTAKNGNIKEIVGVSWGFRPVKELEEAGAKYIINKPYEILELVDKINNNLK